MRHFAGGFELISVISLSIRCLYELLLNTERNFVTLLTATRGSCPCTNEMRLFMPPTTLLSVVAGSEQESLLLRFLK